MRVRVIFVASIFLWGQALFGAASMKVPDLQLTVLDRDFTVPVYLTHDLQVAAATVILKFDSQAMAVVDVSVDRVEPEPESLFWREGDGWHAFSWIMDMLPPYDGHTLGPGEDLLIGEFVAELAEDVHPGIYELSLPWGKFGDPPLRTAIVVNDQNVFLIW